jgi:hypothetical protein
MASNQVKNDDSFYFILKSIFTMNVFDYSTQINRQYLTVVTFGSGAEFVDCLTIFQEDKRPTRSVCGSVKIPVGVWYHLAFVYHGTSRLVYVNGRLEGSDANMFNLSAKKIVYHKSFIGSKPPGSIDFIHASLDEIKLFKKTLNREQIVLDMKAVGGGSIADGIC